MPPLTLEQVRARFAEALRVTRNLSSPALVSALASVPRERFLGAGPWTIYGGEAGARPRRTNDDDPRHLYHDVSVALDAECMLVNGQPGLLSTWLDALAIAPGERVLHVGCGTGYYSALAGQMTSPSGRVIAVEVDDALAARARTALAEWPWIEVRSGNGCVDVPNDCDVILVNAGATHVLDAWLDALRAGGRLLVPLTVEFPGMPGHIGKGVVCTIARQADGWTARIGGMVVVYSLTGGRDAAMNEALGRALQRGPRPDVTRLRRDSHARAETCWLHGSTTCLSR